MKRRVKKSIAILSFIFLYTNHAYSQVGINTSAPTDGTILDITSTDKGVLIPRIALTSAILQAPITSTGTLTDGVLIYNTNTAGTGSAAVIPGFYYWETNKWIPVTGNNGKDWSVTGNNGTSLTNNFLGTIDNVGLAFRTNNTERMRISNLGTAGIGTGTFIGVGLSILNAGFNQALYTSSNSTIAGIFNDQIGTGTGLFSRATSGSAVYGQAGTGGTGVFGQATTGPGVFGLATSGNGTTGLSTSGTGVRGTSTSGRGVTGTSADENGIFGTTNSTFSGTILAGVVGLGTVANGTTGMLGYTPIEPTDGTSLNTGVYAISGSTEGASPDYRNVGLITNGEDLGMYSIGKAPIDTNGDIDSGYFTSNNSGSPTDSDTDDPIARLAGYRASVNIPGTGGGGFQPIYYGAYLYSGGNGAGSSYAYAGSYYKGTTYKIVGNGTVSTIVEDENGNKNRKTMFASEAPEVLFEDYGVGQLSNGMAQINIDPILARNIIVDNKHPLKVFIQLEGDCNGVYVTNKSSTSFTVKELQNGTSNVSFSYHIVANRKDAVDANGTVVSKFADLRFPDAPQAIPQTKTKTTRLPKVNKDKNIIPKIPEAPALEPEKE